VEDEARRQNITECVLHANHYATGFYERIGYRIVEDIYEDGLNLVLMRKELLR